MNLSRKLEIAKTAIASITRHDDASGKELAAAIKILDDFIDSERTAAIERREARESARVELLKRST